MKQTIKNLIFFVSTNKLRINFRIKKLSKKNLITIINLHKISDEKNSTWPSMDPIIFRKLLNFIGNNFQVITFEDIKKFKNQNFSNKKPFLIISFDDGYKNFIEYAMPILKEFKFKANHNLIPECIESNLPPINVIAQDFIAQAPIELIENINLEGFKKNFFKNFKHNDTYRFRLGNKISHFIKNHNNKKQKHISLELMKQFKNFNEFKITKMMNKENIKQISKDIEIGNHSYYHSSMLEETDNFFLKDLVKSQNYFYNNFNFYPDIYAFPNGSYNYNKILIAKKNGIKKILLVGTKLSKFNENIFFRINFHSSSNNENIYKVMRNYNRI